MVNDVLRGRGVGEQAAKARIAGARPVGGAEAVLRAGLTIIGTGSGKDDRLADWEPWDPSSGDGEKPLAIFSFFGW